LIYRFGPFTLDASARRLTRNDADVPLADRHVDVLLRLLAQPGDVVAKDALVQAAWPDVAVTDNSLEQAISMLRKVMADHQPGRADDPRCASIETLPRRGYRFAGQVTREAGRQTDEALDALLAPHRAWLEGRAALESLSVQGVAAAEHAFSSVLASSPDHAAAHVGLANALLFRFEATRVDEQPDLAALSAAMPHARDACRLQPEWAEAWATFALLLHRAGQANHGIAAARRAVDLEPDNWRHHLRLAFAGWGEARLRAAQRTLQLMPGLALAHFLAASVHVARQAFEAADRELRAGTAAQDGQVEGAMFSGVGLHWLSGLLYLAQGDPRAAASHFERELASEGSGHLYARECCAATWYAKGAEAFHRGDRDAAGRAFEEVLQRVPRHPLALAARVIDASNDPFEERLQVAHERGASVDVAVARAVRQYSCGESAAPSTVLTALQQSAPGASGWILPVEPMLRPGGDLARWGSTLALLRARAA
jgi:DNA-binding winged helix-turn-helix (wHTH) protein